MSKEVENRRKIGFRDNPVAVKVSRWLSSTSVTPNMISIASVAFSIVACWMSYIYSVEPEFFYPFVIAILIQCRLLCNLFDGMVAIEGGKKTNIGELMNELPDRLSDSFIILGLGFLASNDFALTLIWISVALSIFTAYIRLLGVTMGCPSDFSGIMAKQKRMALITLGFVVFGVLELLSASELAFDIASDSVIIFLFIGLVVTCCERVINILDFKKNEDLAERR